MSPGAPLHEAQCVGISLPKKYWQDGQIYWTSKVSVKGLHKLV